MYYRIFNTTPHLRVLSVLACCLALAACSTKPAGFTQESFSIDSPYKSRLDSNSTIACESARRVLLGDGYIIDTYSKENIKGRKAYRSDSDGSTFIEMNIVCVGELDASMVYANGLLSTYDVKRSSGSASVGVSALGSVSLPFGQSADSMVKTSDETIRDPEFYRRFFNVVNIVMARIKKAEEDADLQAKQALAEQQKQDKFTPHEESQTVSPNRIPDETADAKELPPTPQVEPARTAEALDEAQQKLPEKPDPATTPSQSLDENPVTATPAESVQPVVPTTPAPTTEETSVTDPAQEEATVADPSATSPKLENQPEPSNPTE